MSENMNGMLVLNCIPTLEVEEKVKVFLSHYAKNVPTDKLDGLINKTPLILSRNTDEKIGEKFASKLKLLGASASYVPRTVQIEKGRRGDKTAHARASIVHEKAEETDPFGTDSFTDRASKHTYREKIVEQFLEANKELWLILSMISIVGAMNYLLASQRMLLGLYTLPTLFSAYFYGRRHATFTAFASVLLVGIAIHYNPSWLSESKDTLVVDAGWYEIMAWGGILMLTAYAMGSLYDRDKKKVTELREAYQGILVILRRFISNDQYTENHCYRVSVYAANIAAYLGFKTEHIEDVRSAALLHDIGKLEVSRKLLYKAARLTGKEYDHMKGHVHKGGEILDPLKGPLGRVLPIILAHHEKYDGSGYTSTSAEDIPLEARILSVADVYDSLTSDRPYRKAMSPFEARDAIAKGTGKEFDPAVVKAFLKAFNRGEMEVPNVVL